jgi:hypothetical protein
VPGETDVNALLAAMSPVLRDEEYVFCTLPPGAQLPDGVVPFAAVREDEGLTIVIGRDDARGMTCSGTHRAITLNVNSSLEAVGFIAAVSRALADMGIPANVIAGYYHDHVLVPSERAGEALSVLERLARLG